jgi:uncharacterized protein (TIGR00304 family)
MLVMGLLLIAMGLALMLWPGQEERQRRKSEAGHSHEGDGSQERLEEKCLRGGGVIMLGPIPIAFGSDPRTLAVLMLLALAMMAIWLLAQMGQ